MTLEHATGAPATNASHTGPLAALGYNPRSRYYGAATTSSFYPVVLSELWNWTGDKSLVRSLIPHALKALRWKEDYTQLRNDGFYYYRSRSEQGNKHQGWKDSADAIVYEDGTEAEPPIATCEEQGFVYALKAAVRRSPLVDGQKGRSTTIVPGSKGTQEAL